MNVPFKLISEPAARRFGNCVWDLVPQRSESSLPFLYTPPTLHWDQQRNIPTILIRLRTNKMQTGKYMIVFLITEESFLFLRVSIETLLFLPEKNVFYFLLHQTTTTTKTKLIRYKISLSENLVQWKQQRFS